MRGCIIASFSEKRTVSYFVTLQSNRVLELTPLVGAPQPCRVRFQLRASPATDGPRVVVQLERVSETGAPWKGDMREPLARWCVVYLGCQLAPGVPRVASSAAPAVQGELGVQGQARYAEPGK